MYCTLNKRLADWTEKKLPGLSSIKKTLHAPTHLIYYRILPHPRSHTGHASAQFASNHKATTAVKVIKLKKTGKKTKAQASLLGHSSVEKLTISIIE